MHFKIIFILFVLQSTTFYFTLLVANKYNLIKYSLEHYLSNKKEGKHNLKKYLLLLSEESIL